MRLPWLYCLYWPFWRSVNAGRRAWRAAFDSSVELVTHDELIAVTMPLEAMAEQ